jgi:hypothetical protein
VQVRNQQNPHRGDVSEGARACYRTGLTRNSRLAHGGNTVIAPNPDGFVYCAASTGTAPCPKKASKQTVNYVGETKGWVCKASVTGDHRGAHSTDPLTGDNYHFEIEHTLSNFGLVPIAYGPTGGSATGSSFCRETDH